MTTISSKLPLEKSFHVRNGGITFRSLLQLKEEIETISEEDFLFHLKNGKNDFAEWILHVYNLPELASGIKKIKTKKGLVKKLQESGI